MTADDIERQARDRFLGETQWSYGERYRLIQSKAPAHDINHLPDFESNPTRIEMTKPWKPDICMYHFPCDDGFASAWVVWKKWGDTVDFRPTNYGQDVPDKGIDGKNILIADFSFKPDVLRAMGERAASIVVLDHHKTAKEDLKGFNEVVGGSFDNVGRLFAKMTGPGTNILIEFNMKESGASLTWNFCFPDEGMPRLLKYIKDRDLWTMKLEYTRPVSLLLRSYPYDFHIWNSIAGEVQAIDAYTEATQPILAEALAIERFYNRKVEEIAKTAILESVGGHDGVAVAFAPYAFESDVAHELLQRHEGAPFAAVIILAHGGQSFSLRSEDRRVDVSEVARKFGGGGHRNAAGFRVTAGTTMCGQPVAVYTSLRSHSGLTDGSIEQLVGGWPGHHTHFTLIDVPAMEALPKKLNLEGNLHVTPYPET